MHLVIIWTRSLGSIACVQRGSSIAVPAHASCTTDCAERYLDATRESGRHRFLDRDQHDQNARIATSTTRKARVPGSMGVSGSRRGLTLYKESRCPCTVWRKRRLRRGGSKRRRKDLCVDMQSSARAGSGARDIRHDLDDALLVGELSADRGCPAPSTTRRQISFALGEKIAYAHAPHERIGLDHRW